MQVRKPYSDESPNPYVPLARFTRDINSLANPFLPTDCSHVSCKQKENDDPARQQIST